MASFVQPKGALLHQNVKLMILGAKLPELSSSEFKTCHDFPARIICNPPLPRCHLGSCPGVEEIKEYLITLFDHNMIENIMFK